MLNLVFLNQKTTCYCNGSELVLGKLFFVIYQWWFVTYYKSYHILHN